MIQPVVHEDEDGVDASELLRSDVMCVDILEVLPGLVHADHGEGGEGLHHGGALACDFENYHHYFGFKLNH